MYFEIYSVSERSSLSKLSLVLYVTAINFGRSCYSSRTMTFRRRGYHGKVIMLVVTSLGEQLLARKALTKSVS